MASSDYIPSFPAEIHRDYFGSWLSGLTDGEGHFGIGYINSKSPWCRFSIGLRADDRPILELIRQYWHTGTINENRCYSRKGAGSLVVRLSIHKTADLHDIIIPHFEKFPLISKKARNFQVFKEAVELLCKVKYKHGYFAYKLGHRRWTNRELETFRSLYEKIHQFRDYDPTL
jgi:LAGLIDADG endonuclease